MSITHGQLVDLLFCKDSLSIEASLIASQIRTLLSQKVIDILVLVDNFLDRFEFALFLLALVTLLLLFFPTGDCRDLETLVFQFVMLHELIRTTVVGVTFIQNILANFVESFGDV